MCWPWPEEDLYWFWSQKVKSQGHIWTLKFASFLHDNSITFRHTIMILHTLVGQHPNLCTTICPTLCQGMEGAWGIDTYSRYILTVETLYFIHIYETAQEQYSACLLISFMSCLQAALIMQVLQLTDQQIAMLPPDQRTSILILKDQISKSAAQW